MVKPEIEVYALWYEYLKRSKDYKEFCEWMRKKRKNRNTPVPEKYHKNKHGGAHPFVFTFLRFHNVHKNSFKEWYKYHEEIRRNIRESGTPKGIENYSDFVGYDINRCVDSFKRREGREPTIQELKNSLANLMKKEKYALWLMVSPAGRKTKELTRQFAEIIKKHKDETPLRELQFKRNLEPTSKRKMNEIKTYLEVYDLRLTGSKWMSITAKIFGKYTKYKQREILRFHSKAKKIIRNAERGVFPGKYE